MSIRVNIGFFVGALGQADAKLLCTLRPSSVLAPRGLFDHFLAGWGIRELGWVLQFFSHVSSRFQKEVVPGPEAIDA